MTTYPLSEYLDLFRTQGLLAGEPEQLPRGTAVALISCDSQQVVPGTLFLCKGSHFKAEYLQDAANRGAFCYVSERAYPQVDLPHIPVTDIRQAMVAAAAFYYERPWEKLKLVGVTGTKGKSTCVYYIKSILDRYSQSLGGGETGLVSSIDTYDGEERFESHLTTPEPLELQRHFAHAAKHQLGWFSMEVSSQALKYDRVKGIDFSVACFLNIGRDHISAIEHTDWEDYFSAKLKIFRQCRVGVVNLDARHADRILEAAQQAQRVVTFSMNDPSADVYGYDLRQDGDSVAFRVRTPRGDTPFRLSMPGLFNVQNALAAISVCTALGVDRRSMYIGLMRARVPGRMEIFTNSDRRIVAIVDYAHNRLSFEKLFQSVQEEYPGRKIVTVFGCPGKKAQERRRDLGELSGRFSQHVYLTEEDPGEEDAADICREIATYVEAEGCPYTILTDRGEAIAAAVDATTEDTVILITGKGAETREKRGLAYIPVPSDVEYVKRSIQTFDSRHDLDGFSRVQCLLNEPSPEYGCAGKTIVIKYGGSALVGNDAVDTILRDVAVLRMSGARVVLVHGGGKNIDAWLGKLGVIPHFCGGYRVTDRETMDVVEMTLSGRVNKQIVCALRGQGISAVGISGRDGGLFTAKAKCVPGVELGQVGEITAVDPGLVHTLMEAGYVPVISPVAAGEDGSAYNINADDAACAVAKALQAEELIYLTDVDGILMDASNDSTLLHTLTLGCARELLEVGMISGGMAPKLQNCVSAMEGGIRRVMVLDGRVEHTILLAVAAGQLRGTMLVP